MEKIYKTKILDIIPNCLGEGNINQITDAYVNFEVNGINFWCFVHEGWTTGKWSLSMKNQLVPVKFVFLNIPESKTERYDKKEKKIIPKDTSVRGCDHYTLMGEIVNKTPNPRASEEHEYLQVDCGFIVHRISSKKNKFKIGDYIKAEGRLDAYLAENEK